MRAAHRLLDVVLEDIVTACRTILSVVILFACGHPPPPLIVGEERQGDESEDSDAEKEFHGWG
jgi:hypothetical protein